MLKTQEKFIFQNSNFYFKNEKFILYLKIFFYIVEFLKKIIL